MRVCVSLSLSLPCPIGTFFQSKGFLLGPLTEPAIAIWTTGSVFHVSFQKEGESPISSGFFVRGEKAWRAFGEFSSVNESKLSSSF